MVEERGFKKTLRDIYNDGIGSRDIGSNLSFNTTFGEGIVAQRHTEIVEQFQYNINTKTLSTTVANGGTVTQDDSMAVITSSTAINGAAQLQTKKKLRYRPGHEGYGFFTALWSSGGVAGAKQYIGLFNVTDGYFLGYNGTDFVVGRRKDSVDTTTSTLNGDPLFTEKFDPTKLNIFQITYGWLGTAPVNFYWMDSNGKWRLIHKMKLPNTLTGPSVTNPALPVCVDITKTSGATSLIMKTASWHAGISHDGDTEGDRRFTGTISATNVTTEVVLINFRNKSTYASKTNQVRAVAEYMAAASDGTKTGIIKIYKNLAIGGTPSWGDVDTTNSIMETDTAGTVTPSDANLLMAIPLGRQSSQAIQDLGQLNFFLYPGETATITGQSSANMDFIFTARWREEF